MAPVYGFLIGSNDTKRNDYQSDWNTDQFAKNVPELALAYYMIPNAGGFSSGGTKIDAK